MPRKATSAGKKAMFREAQFKEAEGKPNHTRMTHDANPSAVAARAKKTAAAKKKTEATAKRKKKKAPTKANVPNLGRPRK